MIGIDIVKVARVEESLKNTKFHDKILNSIEKDYVLKYKQASKVIEANSVAGFYAAKEAILKAFGVGITNGYGFLDITINHDEFGAPVVILSEKLNALLNEKKKKRVSVSISHDGEYATAIAMLE